MMSSKSSFGASPQVWKISEIWDNASRKLSFKPEERCISLLTPRFYTILGEGDWKRHDINDKKCRVEFSFAHLSCSG